MTIESGPAAGVIAAALAGKELGVPNLISFTVSDLARPFASGKFYKRRWGEGHGMRVIGQSPDPDDAAGMVRPRSVLDVLVHRSLRWAAAQGGAIDRSGRRHAARNTIISPDALEHRARNPREAEGQTDLAVAQSSL
jgi:hypothetical protein